MHFQVTGSDPKSSARSGVLKTDHGEIQTPIFMPVGTAGTVKAVHQRELENDIQAQIILGNTYHLYLRPGLEVLESGGGLHQFNSWKKPILTDSGGYQVYSLAHRRKITEEGVMFQSHIDGSRHQFTPENVMDIQRIIGGDIIMAFDECPPFTMEKKYVDDSMEMTHRWLKRCIDRFTETPDKYGYSQALFPIVQGGVFPDLRTKSAEVIASFDMEGNAIGGLSVGENIDDMYAMTSLCCGILPQDKPRYLMGVGTPENILECISLGVDMFDCVMPTRNARHGLLFTSEGIINIKNEKWRSDFNPIDSNLDNYSSNHYSKAYLRHLIRSNEILGAQIATLHNLAFYLWLVKTAREKINTGDFSSWKDQMVAKLKSRL